MVRIVYRIFPDAEGWKVTQNGRFIAGFDTSDVAMSYARSRAKLDRLKGDPSQIVVHRADGTIERKWMYGEGSDPPPGSGDTRPR